jgi:hypothetical protein
VDQRDRVVMLSIARPILACRHPRVRPFGASEPRRVGVAADLRDAMPARGAGSSEHCQRVTTDPQSRPATIPEGRKRACQNNFTTTGSKRRRRALGGAPARRQRLCSVRGPNRFSPSRVPPGDHLDQLAGHCGIGGRRTRGGVRQHARRQQMC